MRSMIKYISLAILLLYFTAGMSAQSLITVKGKVLDAASKLPLENVQVSSLSAKSTALTNDKGEFNIEVSDPKGILEIKSVGYFSHELALLGRTNLTVYLLPERSVMYSDDYEGIYGNMKTRKKLGTVASINKKDLSEALSAVDDGLAGKMAGVRVLNKSGMPGSGSLVNIRGTRSLVAENTPLIVVDGIPYLPDQDVSSIINGFSRNIFAPINLKDVESVTLLTGAEAAMYGSLASNGVLLINTQRASDMETKIEFQTVDGVGFMKKRLPVLGVDAFKNYISDVAETAYTDLNKLTEDFPFLKDDPNNHYAYLYNNNTDWQEEIYTPAVSSENVLKIKGGDAIATYALSAGFLLNQGVIKNTKQQKYFTRLNSNINITKKLEMSFGVGFNYGKYDLMEQGMSYETSPLLTALRQSPLLSIYKQDQYKNNLPSYNPVQIFGISNPVAVVNDINAESRAYDVLVNLGLTYRMTSFITFDVLGGLYYNYAKENIFIPGKSSKAIAPLMNARAENTVRSGTSEGLSFYVKATGNYNRIFNNTHEVSAKLGYQLMSSRREQDNGSGINSASDYYQSLSNSLENKSITGYIDEVHWMNAFANVLYGFNHQYYIGATVGLDASSVYGKNSGRAFFMPSGQVAWKAKNASFLRDNETISNLVIRGQYGMNGNSRYSYKYSRYYYESIPLRTTAALVRAGLPNLQMKPERNFTANVGADVAFWGNRLNLTVDLYQELTKDMVLNKKMAPAYGFRTMYSNAGELKTNGLEASFSVNVLAKKDLNWVIGGNIATYRSEIKSLGGAKVREVEMNNGVVLHSEVGGTPNAYWGYVMDKVISSKAEASRLGLRNSAGELFGAGDIAFQDMNGDKIINENDMVKIGDPSPDFYGGFYTQLNYKNFGLYANFTYSYGNDIYNGLRRSMESMSDYGNQSVVADRRWTSDGQVTDIPRAYYGDPIKNNRFSSRWIEDGSYLKLKEITLSYTTTRKVLFFNTLKAYITGENLLTWTKYSGFDPEFGYSYAPEYAGLDLGQIPLSRNVKVGLILNF